MNILVPIDFSNYSDYAIQYASQIATKLNGNITLYHCIQNKSHWFYNNIYKISLDKYDEQISTLVESKMDTIKNELSQKGISTKYFISKGFFLDDITKFINENDVQLIIMGSHGASSKEEWFLGTNTQKVMRKVNCNVLVVKSEPTDLSLKKILFVSALNTEDKKAFRKVLDFAKPFGLEKVHILTVDTTSFFSQPSIIIKEAMNDFKFIAQEYDVKGFFYPDINVESAVRHYTEDHDFDLISISYHKRHPIKRLLFGSNVEMIANHSKTPVLSIDY